QSGRHAAGVARKSGNGSGVFVETFQGRVEQTEKMKAFLLWLVFLLLAGIALLCLLDAYSTRFWAGRVHSLFWPRWLWPTERAGLGFFIICVIAFLFALIFYVK